MIIYVLILLFTCFHLNASEQYVDKSYLINLFKDIPLEDQKKIQSLFKDLFFNDVFPYSLFGDKPISVSTEILYKHSPSELVKLLAIEGYCKEIFEPYEEPNTLKEKWDAWEKYRDLFKSNQYTLIKNQVGEYSRILFINRKAFIAVVNQNIDLFQKFINANLTAEILLKKIEDQDSNILEILNNNQGLFGILLGFGQYNSMLFQKREELLKALKIPFKNFLIIQQEIDTFNSKLKLLHSHDSHPIVTTNRIGFVAEYDHPETIYLRNKYTLLNRKIREIYSKDDWFEQTLLRLSSK